MIQITEEAVRAAADALLAEGKTPTQIAVRQALGGGSYSTIGPRLQAWRARQEEAAELAEISLPQALAAAGSELTARIWKMALAEAQAGHAALRKEMRQAQTAAEAAQRETTEIAASLEAELAICDDRIGVLETQLATQEDRLESMEERAIVAERDLAGARERAEGEEGRALRAEAHAEDLSVRATRLETELSGLRDRLDVLNAALADQKVDAARIAGERDHVQHALDATRAVNTKMEDRLEKAEAKTEHLRASLDRAMEDLSATRSDLATVRVERSQAMTRVQETQDELARLRKLIDDAAMANGQSSTQNARPIQSPVGAHSA